MNSDGVVLVRHGEVNRTVLRAHDSVYSGARFDFVPLSDAGVRQAEQAAATLSHLRPRLIITSPYTRTLQTAAVLSQQLACPFSVDLRLHDWLPVRDGTSPITAALVQAKIREYQSWEADGPLPPTRTWETPDEMRTRLQSAIRAHQDAVPLVVVTHEAPIRAIVGSVVIATGSLHLVGLSVLNS